MTIVERVTTWVDVCALDDLVADRGACALVGPHQVALFRVSPDGTVYALSNYDPFSGAFVLSRGIVGSTGDTRLAGILVNRLGKLASLLALNRRRTALS